MAVHCYKESKQKEKTSSVTFFKYFILLELPQIDIRLKAKDVIYRRLES